MTPEQKKQLKTKYLILWRKADAILKQPDNPCQIRMENGKATCVVSRRDPSWARPGLLCCEGCKHHSEDGGCQVKCLGCKLSWCLVGSPTINRMELKDHPTFIEIARLRNKAIDMELPLRGRASMEECFGE